VTSTNHKVSRSVTAVIYGEVFKLNLEDTQ